MRTFAITNRISYSTMHFGANPNLSKIVQIQQFFDSCCPGADIAPASTEPNVTIPPNFAQSTVTKIPSHPDSNTALAVRPKRTQKRPTYLSDYA